MSLTKGSFVRSFDVGIDYSFITGFISTKTFAYTLFCLGSPSSPTNPSSLTRLTNRSNLTNLTNLTSFTKTFQSGVFGLWHSLAFSFSSEKRTLPGHIPGTSELSFHYGRWSNESTYHVINPAPFQQIHLPTHSHQR